MCIALICHEVAPSRAGLHYLPVSVGGPPLICFLIHHPLMINRGLVFSSWTIPELSTFMQFSIVTCLRHLIPASSSTPAFEIVDRLKKIAGTLSMLSSTVRSASLIVFPVMLIEHGRFISPISLTARCIFERSKPKPRTTWCSFSTN